MSRGRQFIFCLCPWGLSKSWFIHVHILSMCRGCQFIFRYALVCLSPGLSMYMVCPWLGFVNVHICLCPGLSMSLFRQDQSKIYRFNLLNRSTLIPLLIKSSFDLKYFVLHDMASQELRGIHRSSGAFTGAQGLSPEHRGIRRRWGGIHRS